MSAPNKLNLDYVLRQFPWEEFPQARQFMDAERQRLGLWLRSPHLHNLAPPTLTRMRALHAELSRLLRAQPEATDPDDV